MFFVTLFMTSPMYMYLFFLVLNDRSKWSLNRAIDYLGSENYQLVDPLGSSSGLKRRLSESLKDLSKRQVHY